MTASEQFLKFAAECEFMAKLSQERESNPVWHRLAERWVRCAQMAEQQRLAAQEAHRRKRDREAKRHHSELQP